ncbi:MAG: LysM peptidoglycan-binding domain-containing protein [Anaerolineae bacterium]|jgi:hypothetical protein|nr:LysM peptidoglycan-binding domain-containing protein [Chloroflexota bacterium]
MPDRRIALTVDEQLARRLRAKAALAGETLANRLSREMTRWLGSWGLQFSVHVVKAGESLASIARDYYGDAQKHTVLAAYNDIENPNLIGVGQVLRIPEVTSQPGAPTKGESPYIFGIHDRAGAQLMAEGGRRGWVLSSHVLGANRDDWGSESFQDLADAGFGVIARLNHGDGHNGTLPHSTLYGNFAVRCANFVERSAGCHIWVIGNEPNVAGERAGGPENGERITPERYARAFAACRNAIHSRAGHQRDQVVIGAVGPWNAQTVYRQNPTGDWIVYFQHVLDLLAGQLDGIALHTYARSANPAEITSDARMSAPWDNRRSGFRSYVDFMEAIPTRLRQLPVYITETNQNVPWQDVNRGWVREAYAEVDRWNSNPANQKIRAMILYRWGRHPQDDWQMAGKSQVLADWKAALQNDYRWYR